MFQSSPGQFAERASISQSNIGEWLHGVKLTPVAQYQSCV